MYNQSVKQKKLKTMFVIHQNTKIMKKIIKKKNIYIYNIHVLSYSYVIKDILRNYTKSSIIFQGVYGAAPPPIFTNMKICKIKMTLTYLDNPS